MIITKKFKVQNVFFIQISSCKIIQKQKCSLFTALLFHTVNSLNYFYSENSQ